ncbi:MAG: isocitrate lyase/phosphoenolpyruvate mutase family protein [Pseudomonadales bacterium]
MNQREKAEQFSSLHVPGTPLVLYNIWDAGGAKALQDVGASAVATGSWSVAAAHGYADGEAIPLDLVEQIAARICTTTTVPVSIDFEGGYAREPESLGHNVRRIIAAGAVGINFEDQIVSGTGLHDVATQSARIRAIHASAKEQQMPLFINARTDLFLQAPAATDHASLLPQAQERAEAYASAGASGLFLPGLIDADLIAKMCTESALPVNIMMKDGAPGIAELAKLGVARVSFGPGPYFHSIADLKQRAGLLLR